MTHGFSVDELSLPAISISGPLRLQVLATAPGMKSFEVLAYHI